MPRTFHFIFHVQLQKSLINSENERRVVTERLEASQQTLAELRRMNQHLTDQNQRLQTELANNEVQRSGLEAQLRLASWPPEGAGTSSKDEELMQQLRTSQRERMELRGKVESLLDKVNI
jgi:rootletin